MLCTLCFTQSRYTLTIIVAAKKAVQTTACDESSSPIGNLLMATQYLKQLQICRIEFGC